ncbi:phosphate ABC transporter ATP-binding protein PstB [Lacticigenium naphthae]|uniref:phosphate ABC transporter ATP-binding protein PstB n=1 Tax=Lacticigenium naphthae TaxID=515351 RepID=UPI0003F649B0|nr:phosphate ABC transporter ATP-binding protein PstB [Lacticigenium naphthae]
MNEQIVSTENVHLYYGDFEALKGISMEFYDNQITALIGPSGCGKSTYLRLINRMNDLIPGVKITGKVNYDGKNVYDEGTDTVELRKKIGMVFQQPNPFPFSIYENVAYGLKIAGMKDKNKIDEIVERSLRKAAIWNEVKDKLDENALALSGGQQQRVCIARVLAIEPDVILLDEPTSALDPISSGKIERMLEELKKEYTIIIVTHNMQQASRISDRTAFFLDGNLIEVDDTRKIFTNPEKKETEDYISGRFG